MSYVIFSFAKAYDSLVQSNVCVNLLTVFMYIRDLYQKTGQYALGDDRCDNGFKNDPENMLSAHTTKYKNDTMFLVHTKVISRKKLLLCDYGQGLAFDYRQRFAGPNSICVTKINYL